MNPLDPKTRDRIVGAVLILVAAIVIAAAWRLPGTAAADAVGPKAYPTALALVLAGLSVALMLGDHKHSGARVTQRQVVFGFVPITIMLALYVLLVQRLGFALSTTALLLACFRLKGERSWTVNVAVAVGASLAIWALFGWLLNVQLKLLPALS